MAKKVSRRSAKASGQPARRTDVKQRICNLEPSRGTETDWSFHDAVGGGALGAPAALPSSVDLRAAWWAIDDQEDTGSCVGWATAEGVVRYHMVKANRLAKNVQLSPRFVWMGSKETDQYVARPRSEEHTSELQSL